MQHIVAYLFYLYTGGKRGKAGKPKYWLSISVI